MIDTEATQAALDTFMTNYFSIHILRSDNVLVYFKVPFGYVNKEVEEANKLIKIMGLPLIAESSSTAGIFTDSFTVKPIQTDGTTEQ